MVEFINNAVKLLRNCLPRDFDNIKYTRCALGAIGAVGITHIPVFAQVFGKHSAALDFYIGGIAALMFYNRLPSMEEKKSMTAIQGGHFDSRQTIVDQMVRGVLNLFQCSVTASSFLYNPKVAIGIFFTGYCAVVISRGDHCFKRSANMLVRDLTYWNVNITIGKYVTPASREATLTLDNDLKSEELSRQAKLAKLRNAYGLQERC